MGSLPRAATCTGAGTAKTTTNNGLFVWGNCFDLRLGPGHVLDGLSRTAMLSERRLGDDDDDRVEPGSDSYVLPLLSVDTTDPVHEACTSVVPGTGPMNQWSRSGASWFLYGFRNTAYNHATQPNGPSCVFWDPPANNPTVDGVMSNHPKGSFTASSRHPGGVGLVLADGSMKFVGDDIDLAIWRALATRAGAAGEAAVSDDW